MNLKGRCVYLSKQTLLGNSLLKKNLITKRQLNNAYAIHTDTNERLSKILIRNEMVEDIEIYKILADLSDNEITTCLSQEISRLKDEINYNFIKRFNPSFLNKKLFMPLYFKEGIVKIIVFNFKDKSIDRFLKDKFGDILIEKVELSKKEIKYFIEYVFKDEIIDRPENMGRKSRETALNVFTRGQLLIAAVIGIFLLTGLFFYFKDMLDILIYTSNTIFLIFVITRFIVYLTKKSKIDKTKERKEKSFDNMDNLPVYSILIPVTNNTSDLKNLILSLKKMDYPAEKMEVIFLGDKKIKDKVKNLSSDNEDWLIYSVPASKLKTEIETYNFGLRLAGGKYITIYKEHTIPEVDQLKKAVFKFENSQKNYFCLQSPLEVADSNNSLFSKYLSIENNLKYKFFSYLDKGTYHYKTAAVKKLGGWDLYNTAENLEIIRKAAAHGYEISIIDSKTFQFSSDNFNNWFINFTNSMKGYMQTMLVYNRNPISKIKEDGLKDILFNNLMIGGELLLPFLYTCLILILAVFLSAGRNLNILTQQLQFLFTVFNLFLFLIFNTYYIFSNNLKIKYLDRILIMPLLPVHWVIKSYAFIKSIMLLIKRPHYRLNRAQDMQEDQIMFMQINFLEKIKETN